VIKAPVFVGNGDAHRNWGMFVFDQLPSPGDRINSENDRGRVQRLRVLHVAHEPLREDQPQDADRPNSIVHAEWIDEFY
jgi:hypothetical protein